MVSFYGINSVLDRTLFTNRGPIVKRPLSILSGINLEILNATDVVIPTGNFTSSIVGNSIAISGTPSLRNDGDFPIAEVLSSTTLRLSNSNLYVVDVSATSNDIIAIVNDLKKQYNLHRVAAITVSTIVTSVHGSNDIINIVTAPDATDLTSAIFLLNDIDTSFNAHVIDVSGVPPVHNMIDTSNIISAPTSTDLPSAIYLANDIAKKYHSHRQKRDVHVVADSIDIVTIKNVKATTGVFPGPFTGPFSWTLKDPRSGMAADSSSDVDVLVNGQPAIVDAVFGQLGAVVLATKPIATDTVDISYSYVGNPPSRLLRLNAPEFNLNQHGNRGTSGLPKHRYRSRSNLIDKWIGPDMMSASQPKMIAWKYKGLERGETAILNDPTTLLLNVPTNKVSYPVLFEKVPEITIRYDATSLPQDSIDKWTLHGNGSFSLAPGGNALTIIDSDTQSGIDNMPPFFHHAINIRATSTISSAFRVLAIDDSSLVTDGVFTGVTFAISDGAKVALVGLIKTEATNLTSAIVLVNSLKVEFNNHIKNLGSHDPDDISDTITIVSASDLSSLIILLNKISDLYSKHIAKGGGKGLVHSAIDTINIVSGVATSLENSIIISNDLKTAYNAHRTQSGIHFLPDIINIVTKVKQIGILKNNDFPEFSDSWESFAQDWTEFITYRLSFDSSTGASLYRSGDIDPGATVSFISLPSLSSIDGRFDSIQQVFFGPIGKESKSTSIWQFIRVNVTPLDSSLIEDNKAVDYEAIVVPELDSSPWITLGKNGFERIVSSDILLLDSSASLKNNSLQEASGNFRGFTRFEPILSSKTAAALEFRFSADWYTHSITNNAMSVVMDDVDFSVEVAFLQYSPSAAEVTSTLTEPFVIVVSDEILLRIENGPIITVTFSSSDTTAAAVSAAINLVAGFTMAEVVSKRVRLKSQNLGVSSSFEIVSGSAISKLGFSPGPYFGIDSNPEPRVSWFGSNFPDQDLNPWTRGGGQKSEMLGSTMRISDSDSLDYLAFLQDNYLVTNQAFNSISDWKLDFRIRVLSFQSGDVETATSPYQNMYFSGALASVDEGKDGKTVELHLVVSASGSPFLNLLSYNVVTNSLDVMSQYAFTWNDGETHSFNIYTSKSLDMVMVLGDGSVLAPFVSAAPTYSGLNVGVTGPSVAFGSGSEAVNNANPKSSNSVVDWQSLTIFKDSKIGDPTSGDRRYVGIYRGGSRDILNSYALYQIDFSIPHIYRIVRNPVTAVSLYIDGSAVPVISIAYDILSLPPSSSSFLKNITTSRSAVSFGAFDSGEMSRTRWDFVRYSIGKISLNDRIVPRHEILNQHNAISSPGHLKSSKQHYHDGFSVYSAGTPLDDFLSDSAFKAYTNLGEGTPALALTRNLESRGGHNKIATAADSIAAVDFVNTSGYITDLDDDTVNGVTSPVATDLSTAINLINEISKKYLSHISQYRVHLANDTSNNILPVDATSITLAITLANTEKAALNKHIVAVIKEIQRVHSSDDTINIVSSPDSFDVPSLIVLSNEISTRYNAHRIETGVHGSTLFIRIEPPPQVKYNGMKFFKTETGVSGLVSPFSDDETLHIDGISLQGDTSLSYDASVLPEDQEALDTQNLANNLRAMYEAHRTQIGVHVTNDISNVITASIASNLTSTLVLLIDLKLKYNNHIIEPGVHIVNDSKDSVYDSDPTVLKMAQPSVNELKLKYGRHIVDLSAHLIADFKDAITAKNAAAVVDPGWVRHDSGLGSPDISLEMTGSKDVLRYGTTASGIVETAYLRDTSIPSDPSLDVEMTVSLRVNSYFLDRNVDSGIYAGIVTPIDSGIGVAIGFDVLDNIPYVKLQDMNKNISVFRTPFNWADALFHTFKIVKDASTGTVSLVVVS